MSGRQRQTALGARLRQMYDNVVREDVPKDFLAFLAAADAREGYDAPRGDDPGPDDGAHNDGMHAGATPPQPDPDGDRGQMA